jgi:hypothetical protein
MEDLIRYNKKIIESVKLLSLSYDEQREYFPNFVDTPFEILDTFENAFLLLPQLVENNFFNNSSVANILRIHNLVAYILRNVDLEDIQSPQWAKLKVLANEAVIVMGEKIEKPDKNYL